MPRKLIITADDFGLMDHIDDAIIDLARKGLITTVSAFGNVDPGRLSTQIAKLQDANPDIGIGAHLTLSSHETCLQVNTTFTENVGGTILFRKTKDFDFNALMTELDALQEELRAQITNLQSALGSHPLDHLSCHHNILYLDERMFERYLQLAAESGVRIRHPRRCTMMPGFKKLRRLQPIFPDYALEGLKVLPPYYYDNALKANLKKQINRKMLVMQHSGVSSSDYFMINLYGNPDIEVLRMAYPAILEEEACEQIMHLSDGNFNGQPVPRGVNADYFKDRKREYDLLDSNLFSVLLESHRQTGMELRDFRRL